MSYTHTCKHKCVSSKSSTPNAMKFVHACLWHRMILNFVFSLIYLQVYIYTVKEVYLRYVNDIFFS